MRQKNPFYAREAFPLDGFVRQVTRCHHRTSGIRGAVRSVGDDKKVFFLWEAEDPLNGGEQMVFQQGAPFSEAKILFLNMLSIMGNAGWQSNPESVRRFLDKLSDSIAYTGEQATMLPKIVFNKA